MSTRKGMALRLEVKHSYDAFFQEQTHYSQEKEEAEFHSPQPCVNHLGFAYGILEAIIALERSIAGR